MDKYELWIMEVGGNENKRIIYSGSNKKELDNAILDNNDEVITNADKYFKLITPLNNLTFYSYADFLNIVELANLLDFPKEI